MNSLYYKIRLQNNLLNSWRSVRQSGKNSKSFETKKEIDIFEEELFTNLKRIQRKLREKNYVFQPAKGILLKRNKKSPRPIVVASVEDRVVQRSILNVLSSQNYIKEIVNNPYSFGGLPGKGVRNAIEKICLAIKNGAKHYIKSDIEDFFQKIPRLKVLNKIYEEISDNSLNDLLEKATNVELDNIVIFDNFHKGLFPKYDLGVAQGFCLSPLFGNILLTEFDYSMNHNSVTCIRYIDDIIILGPDNKTVSMAFKKCLKILDSMKLKAYKTSENSKKAKEGSTDSFNHLGCKISTGFIIPDKESQSRLLKKIDNILLDSIKYFSSLKNNDSKVQSEFSFTYSLKKIHETIRAWGNQYSFCNSKLVFKNLDDKIDLMIGDYIRAFDSKKNKLNVSNRRRMLGVHLVSDSKQNPILPIDKS